MTREKALEILRYMNGFEPEAILSALELEGLPVEWDVEYSRPLQQAPLTVDRLLAQMDWCRYRIQEDSEIQFFGLSFKGDE